MKKTQKRYLLGRQGDIFIVEIIDGEKPSKGKSVKSVVIAEGEQTGHAHVLEPLQGSVILTEDGAINFNETDFAPVWLKGTGILKHQEHAAIKVGEKGKTTQLLFVRQQTFSAIAQQNKRVID